MRRLAKQAIVGAGFGSPSTWAIPGRPNGWHIDDRDCLPWDAAMHDNGCNDALKAVALIPPLPNPEASNDPR